MSDTSRTDEMSDVEILVARFFSWLWRKWKQRRDFPRARLLK